VIFEVEFVFVHMVKIFGFKITSENLCSRETCFDWKEPLVKIFDERE